MTKEEEASKNLEILTAKIDELSNEIKERKEYTDWKIKEKIDALSNEIKERKESTEGKIKERKEAHEEKIRENPLAYVAGAFAGGLVVGYLIERGKNYSN